MEFIVMEWDPKKGAYVVYVHETKSTQSVRVQGLLPIVAAPTEMAPDLVLPDLDRGTHDVWQHAAVVSS